MFISTSGPGIDTDYQVVAMVFACAADKNPISAMVSAANQLKAHAHDQGADAVVFANFATRSAVGQTCFGSQQVLEVYGWGTAVKLFRVGA